VEGNKNNKKTFENDKKMENVYKTIALPAKERFFEATKVVEKEPKGCHTRQKL
jgi:hypothetical protein